MAIPRASIVYGVGSPRSNGVSGLSGVGLKSKQQQQQQQQQQQETEQFYQNQMQNPSAPSRLGSFSKTAGAAMSPDGSTAGLLSYGRQP